MKKRIDLDELDKKVKEKIFPEVREILSIFAAKTKLPKPFQIGWELRFYLIELIKKARKEKKMSQAQLAKK